MTTEIVLTWVAVTCYVVSTAMFVFGVTFEREALLRIGLIAATAGIVPQIAGLAARWVRVGHGPYLGLFEVASSLTLFSVAFFVSVVWRNPRLSPIGIAVMPMVVLLIGGAMLSPKAELNVSPTLASYWLAVHVIFSDLAFGAFVVSFGLAVVYVVRERSAGGPWAERFRRLPAQDVIDHASSRFVLAGFVFWGIMIAAGAIWANEAWGRYWGWDPLETWSLGIWLVYAVYLHLHLNRGWRGEKIAWVAIAAMPICLFSALGIPIAFKSIHAGYLIAE
jgi:cytochrome c-type biogenesis protein CcsB